MEHMPIESEKKAHKLLHVCEKRNMAEQGSGRGWDAHTNHTWVNVPFFQYLSVLSKKLWTILVVLKSGIVLNINKTS